MGLPALAAGSAAAEMPAMSPAWSVARRFMRGLTNEMDFPVPSRPQTGGRHLSATMGSAKSHQRVRKGKSMTILYVDVDLAKNVFALHAVDEAGRAVLVRPSVPRARLLELVASLPAGTIGMEAC